MATDDGGRSQLFLNILLGAVAAILIAFFSWLALAVIEIRVNVATMKGDISSLIETRRDQTEEQRQNTGDRLDRIEGRQKQ